MNASFTSYNWRFLRPAETSRGILFEKPAWYIRLSERNGGCGIGEVSYIPGLSPGDPQEVEYALSVACEEINRGKRSPKEQTGGMPGIQFALECALLDMESEEDQILFRSDFTNGKEGILINGLIWMGNRRSMNEQISAKLEQGFRVLKMKVGAMDPQEELEIIREIRNRFDAEQLEIRLDANGAWTPGEALLRLEQFARLSVHSIEQPIPPGNPDDLASLCDQSPIQVALDEELLGREPDRIWLESVRPDFLILKPGLLGGFKVTEKWISAAADLGIGWWATSALESAVGLSAISQWVYNQGVSIPQGLGTGQIYRDPIPSPLRISGDSLWYNPSVTWDLQLVTGRL